MADLKMPEINTVIISGNLTRDPIFRHTTNGSPVVNFSIASNRRYRDANNQWQEEVCYLGIVAWNRLADSCINRLKKGSAVLIDGELQSHVFKNGDGVTRNVVEVKAQHIQFLNKRCTSDTTPGVFPALFHDDEPCFVEDGSFDKFLSGEESQLLKEQP